MTRVDETLQPFVQPEPDFRQAARNICRRHLPWDEYPQYCAPGGCSDLLEADIAAALQAAWEHQPIGPRSKFNRHGTPDCFD
jgi:hypothetical protein